MSQLCGSRGDLCPFTDHPCPGECIFALAFREISVGAIFLDVSERTIIFCNREARELLQIAQRRIVYDTIETDFLQQINPLLLEQRGRDRNSRKLGPFTIGFTIYRISPTHRFIFLSDISAAERDRVELEAAYRMTSVILEGHPHGFLVYSDAGRLVYANPAARELLGGARSGDMVVLGRFEERDKPTELPRIAAKLVANQTPLATRVLDYVRPHMEGVRKIRLNGVPMETPEGSQALLVLEDITDYMSARRRNELLAATVESSISEIVIMSPKGAIEYVNPAFEHATGYAMEEVVGKLAVTVDTEEVAPDLLEEIRRHLRMRQSWRGRMSTRRKDGTVCQKNVTLYPVVGEDRRLAHIVVSRVDVTERLRLESIAQAVDFGNHLGSVALGMRHELGNPLNVMKTSLSILQENHAKMPPEKVEEYVGKALDAVERIEGLLGELRHFNMYERPVCAAVPLETFLGEFHALVAGTYREKGIELGYAVEPPGAAAWFDPRALKQILLNLYANAADALRGAKAPRIFTRAVREGHRATLTVTDNGEGMNEEVLAQVFQPFYTTKPDGNGLGMPIVRKMLGAMNCTVQLASRPGKGTTVEIVLPLDGEPVAVP